jgi:hypothetical protein
MSLEVEQLADKFQDLDWENCKYVGCGPSFLLEDSDAKCCLCKNNLKTYNSKNHALIGSNDPNVEVSIGKVHYICRRCKKECFCRG